MKTRSGLAAVGGGFLAVFFPGAMMFGFPGVMSPYWQETFRVGRGAVGNVLFFALAAVGLFMFLVGRFQARLGLRTVMTVGAALAGLSTLALVWASHLYHLYLWAFAMGAATCLVYLPALTTVQLWHPHRRGLVSGIISLSFGVAGGLMSPLFAVLLKTMGCQAMTALTALASLAIAVPAARFTSPPASRPEFPSDALPPAEAAPLPRSLTAAQTLRTRSFWFLWLTWALQGAAGVAMVTLSVSFGLSRGLALESAVFFLSAFNLTNGFSRLVMGFLSDHLDRARAMSLTFFLAAGAYLLLPHLSAPLALAGLAAVIGWSFGTLFSVSAPLAVDCFGLTHFGVIFGLIFTAYGFLAGFLGPSLGGYLLDLTQGDFTLVFSYLGCFSLAAAGLIRRVRPPGA